MACSENTLNSYLERRQMNGRQWLIKVFEYGTKLHKIISLLIHQTEHFTYYFLVFNKWDLLTKMQLHWPILAYTIAFYTQSCRINVFIEIL